MSLIVSRSSPLFGSVSAANERRWISIRCGTSRGCESCEKDLRVTGAAADLANWATPQMVEKGHEPARGIRDDKGLNGARRTNIPHALHLVKAAACWAPPAPAPASAGTGRAAYFSS